MRAEYHTSVIPPGERWRTVATATVVPLGILFLGGAAGVPPLLLAPLYLAGVVLLVRARSYRAVYMVDEHGISETLAPLARLTLVKPRVMRAGWDRVESYLEDADLTRSVAVRRTLTIHIKDPACRIRLREPDGTAGREAFAALLGAFRFHADGTAEGPPVPPGPNPAAAPAAPAAPRGLPRPAGSRTIRRRRPFLVTLPGRMLTIAFTVLTLLLVAWVLQAGLTAGRAFRLVFIIIPGVLWMLWRSFGRGSTRAETPDFTSS